MSTNPVVVKNGPIPAIVTVIPVPDPSIMSHDNRTICVPPMLTELGVATNELMVGGGHAVAVIVIWEVEKAPQPFVAVRVYVVVDCGCGMSTDADVPGQVPIPAIVTEMPEPVESSTVQDKRTVWFPPMVTAFGFAVKVVIVGALQGLALIVACATLVVPQPLVTLNE